MARLKDDQDLNSWVKQGFDLHKKKKEAESLFHPREEIVVTATMTRKAVKDCSASVSVVGEDDLKAIINDSMNITEYKIDC